MLAAAVAEGWSTYLYWLPCRDSMLSGIIYGSHHVAPDFSDACLWRMDGDIAYEVMLSELNSVAMGLLGLAWLTLVMGWCGDGGLGSLRHFPVWRRLRVRSP